MSIIIKWILACLALSHSISIAFAGKTYQNYKDERDALTLQHQKLIGIKNQKKATLQSRIAGNRDFTKKIKNQIENSARSKGQELKVQLSHTREQGRLVSLYSKRYTDRQIKLNLKYKEIVAEFDTYYKLKEQQEKDSFLSFYSIEQATKPSELIEPKLKLEKIYLTEGSLSSLIRVKSAGLVMHFKKEYKKYRKKIDPLRSFMDERGIPLIDSPRGAVENLEKMISYADKREITFKAQIHDKFEEISRKTESLLLADLKAWRTEHDANLEHDQQGLDFLLLTNSLVEKLNKTVLSSSPFTHIQGELLKEQYLVYLEILNYSETCGYLEQLNRENSPLFKGCALLSSLAVEAKDFMGTTAWAKIAMNLINHYDAPEKFQTRIEQLREVKKNREKSEPSLLDRLATAIGARKRSSLLEAIILNDSLLKSLDGDTKERD